MRDLGGGRFRVRLGEVGFAFRETRRIEEWDIEKEKEDRRRACVVFMQ